MTPDEAARRYRRIIDDALDLVARGLRDAVTPRMEGLLGAQWWTQLSSPKDGSEFARLDVTSYARVFEHGPHRVELRGCFRVELGQWLPLLQRIRGHRHAFHGHRDHDPTAEEALAVVTDCLRLAERLSLQNAPQLRGLVTQVTGGARVEVDAEELAAYREQAELLAREQARAKGLEQKAAAASAAADDALAALEERRHDEDHALVAKDREIQHLQGRLRAADGGSRAAARLAAELQGAQQERAELQRDQDRTRRELERARQEQSRAAHAEQQAIADLGQARAEVAALQAELVGARVAADEMAARLDAGEMQEQRLLRLVLEGLEQRAEALGTPVASEPAAEVVRLPNVGEPWPFVRGDEAWALSPAGRTLTRLGDGTELSSVVGPVRAAALITQFLRVRPRGGRIWVDDDGDACALVDGRTVYLGRIPTQSAVPAARGPGSGQGDDDAAVVRPGDPWPSATGTFRARIDLAQRDIVTDEREPTSLRLLIGRTRASAVVARLAQGLGQRGSGDSAALAFRVDRYGRAVNDRGRYLGRIRVDEWWQHLIDDGAAAPPPAVGEPAPVRRPPDFQARSITQLALHHWGRHAGPVPRGRRFSESGWEFSGYRMVGCPRCRRALAHFEKQRTADTLWHAYYCPSCPEVYAGSELDSSFLLQWPHDYRCETATDLSATPRASSTPRSSRTPRASSTPRASAPRASTTHRASTPAAASARPSTLTAPTPRASTWGVATQGRSPRGSSSPAPASRGARAGHLGVFDSAAALRIAHPEASTPVGSTATVESRKLGRTFRYTLKVNASTKARYWGGVEA